MDTGMQANLITEDKLNEIVVRPARKVPLPLVNQFKRSLKDLEKSKIIRKVDEPTEWVNSIVIIRKNNGTLRICLDPRFKFSYTTFGIPAILISDGGPQFNSKHFSDFCEQWCIDHTMTSPRYPQSNGMVERSKQAVKKMLRKAIDEKRDTDLVLLMYRNTPSETGFSPCQLMTCRNLRDILPSSYQQLEPQKLNYEEYNKKLNSRGQYQKTRYNKYAKDRKPLKINDRVRYQSQLGSKWSFGRISDKVTQRSYTIKDENKDTELTRNRRFIEIVPNGGEEESEHAHENVHDRSSIFSDQDEENYRIPECTTSGRRVKKPDRYLCT
nr:unnamed protein product [Callosobruchus analis]